ncbi:MAG: hypothetical protein EXQ53_05965, partial [Acidobacteria bacterium]|nr:hypothetical protein [Acidobacteriota bacterium]
MLTASGLESFEREYAGAREYELDGVRVKVLPLERVVASKRAAKRAKDSAQMPMLEAALAARKARTEGKEQAPQLPRRPGSRCQACRGSGRI